jgi:hypothetical protein
MDWDACVICNMCNGVLKCPAISKSNNGLDLYQKFLQLVDMFSEINSLPVQVDFYGHGTPDIFYTNHAKWHTACRLKFAESKLVRAKEKLNRLLLKKERQGSYQREIRKSKRHSNGDVEQDKCIFCTKAFKISSAQVQQWDLGLV